MNQFFGKQNLPKVTQRDNLNRPLYIFLKIESTIKHLGKLEYGNDILETAPKA